MGWILEWAGYEQKLETPAKDDFEKQKSNTFVPRNLAEYAKRRFVTPFPRPKKRK